MVATDDPSSLNGKSHKTCLSKDPVCGIPMGLSGVGGAAGKPCGEHSLFHFLESVKTGKQTQLSIDLSSVYRKRN